MFAQTKLSGAILARSKKAKASRLGKLVLERGWISAQQLEVALEHQKQYQCRLGESLTALRMIENSQLKVLLRRQKVLRSLVASCVIAAAPISPALAEDKADTVPLRTEFEPVASANKMAEITPIFNNNLIGQTADIDFTLNDELDESSQIRLDVTADDTFFEFQPTHLYIPEMTTEKISTNSTRSELLTQIHFKKKWRSDRYKYSQPTIYRLTIRGFSLMEKREEELSFANFTKVKDYPYRRYELMFSIRKDF